MQTSHLKQNKKDHQGGTLEAQVVSNHLAQLIKLQSLVFHHAPKAAGELARDFLEYSRAFTEVIQENVV